MREGSGHPISHWLLGLLSFDLYEPILNVCCIGKETFSMLDGVGAIPTKDIFGRHSAPFNCLFQFGEFEIERSASVKQVDN